MHTGEISDLEIAYLDLDGDIAAILLMGMLRLATPHGEEIALSPLAQAQLLEHLYQRRGALYQLTPLDLEGSVASDWIRSDPFFRHHVVESIPPSSSHEEQIRKAGR